MDEQMQKASGINYGAVGAAGVSRASPPREAPSADTLTGQMMYLDELIKSCHEILARVTRSADALVPDNSDAGHALNKISPSADSGPLLFRLQNRTSEMGQLHGAIHRQLSRIDGVL